MKFLMPIILVVAAGAVFFGFVDPTYTEIKGLKEQEGLFTEALDNSKQLQAIRDQLLAQYNSFATSDLDRLQKLLPNNVDNVRLVRDIDGIAAQYGMTLRSVSIEVQDGSAGLEPANGKYGSVSVGFTVSASYDTFLAFMETLEKSLRVVDVTNISFVSSDQNLYEFRVSLRTYWLK